RAVAGSALGSVEPNPSAEFRDHEIDEGADLWREMARLRIDQPDRIDAGSEFFKYRLKLAGGESVVDVIAVDLRKPITRADRIAERGTVTEAHIALWRDGRLHLGAGKSPVSCKSCVAQREGQAIVGGKVGGTPRPTVLGEIARRADDAELSL